MQEPPSVFAVSAEDLLDGELFDELHAVKHPTTIVPVARR
jgi:hypothetical protein